MYAASLDNYFLGGYCSWVGWMGFCFNVSLPCFQRSQQFVCCTEVTMFADFSLVSVAMSKKASCDEDNPFFLFSPWIWEDSCFPEKINEQIIMIIKIVSLILEFFFSKLQKRRKKLVLWGLLHCTLCSFQAGGIIRPLVHVDHYVKEKWLCQARKSNMTV